MRHPIPGVVLVVLVLSALSVLLLAPGRASAEDGGVVYYQVTHEKGQVRDLNDVPKDDKGIRRVVRIARFEPDTRGYQVLSTGPLVLAVLNPGRTVMSDLKWNGKAWVGDVESPRPAKVTPTTQPATQPAEAEEGQSKPASPSGKVKACDSCPIAKGDGVVERIDGRRVLPHRVQVWKLPAGTGERTYRITMEHAEAGTFGEFYYVAYADTDGDGLPDKLVAQSPVAVAELPGQWTSWTFGTSEGTVFVGNAWRNEDACVYYRRADAAEKNWSGLSSEVYVSGFFGGCPKQKFRAYLTNIRVRIEEPNPDASSGSVIIVK